MKIAAYGYPGRNRVIDTILATVAALSHVAAVWRRASVFTPGQTEPDLDIVLAVEGHPMSPAIAEAYGKLDKTVLLVPDDSALDPGFDVLRAAPVRALLAQLEGPPPAAASFTGSGDALGNILGGLRREPMPPLPEPTPPHVTSTSHSRYAATDATADASSSPAASLADASSTPPAADSAAATSSTDEPPVNKRNRARSATE